MRACGWWVEVRLETRERWESWMGPYVSREYARQAALIARLGGFQSRVVRQAARGLILVAVADPGATQPQ